MAVVPACVHHAWRFRHGDTAGAPFGDRQRIHVSAQQHPWTRTSAVEIGHHPGGKPEVSTHSVPELSGSSRGKVSGSVFCKRQLGKAVNRAASFDDFLARSIYRRTDLIVGDGFHVVLRGSVLAAALMPDAPWGEHQGNDGCDDSPR
jgi:hypothetical protein